MTLKKRMTPLHCLLRRSEGGVRRSFCCLSQHHQPLHQWHLRHLLFLLVLCSQSEGGDVTVSPTHLTDEDERPESPGGTEKNLRPEEQKENLVFITDFGEKISLFLPGFDVDAGETTAERVPRKAR